MARSKKKKTTQEVSQNDSQNSSWTMTQREIEDYLRWYETREYEYGNKK